jgi:hypothetical protein
MTFDNKKHLLNYKDMDNLHKELMDSDLSSFVKKQTY